MDQLADRIGRALQSADLDAYCELLDPRVSWGPPDEPKSGCHSREEVLTWYRRAHAEGVRATVTETAVTHDKILVGLRVRDVAEVVDDIGEANRWQVLTIVDGKVLDIRGFDDREEALRRLT
jgi:hypothetical protein